MKKVLMMLSMVLVLFIVANVSADPITYGFYNITNNLPGDKAIGEAQLFVDVSGAGGQATFHFYNTGPAASSITQVYFDDGALLGIASIVSGPGTDFSQYGSPPNLPGWNNASPPFHVSIGFLATADPPVEKNGVNPNEYLDIIFNLQTGKSLDDVIAALALAGADGGLRIGIHVQGFDSGGSESFINNPTTTTVPEPGILILLGIAMSAIGMASWRITKI
jgi:hypothetical protein